MSFNLSHKAALAGVYEHPARFAPDKSMFQIMAESVRGALDDAGLTIKDVDGVCTAGMGMGAMGIVGFCDYMNLTPNFLDGTNIGGSSFVAHTAHAAAAIHAGLCNVAVVVYGSNAASARFAIGTGGGGGGGDPCDQYEFPYGPTTVGAYAMIAQRHMHDYGTKPEQLAEIAVTMRHHASMNPVAKYRDPITVEDVLASRLISSPLHLLDCCIISDGGGALVVTSAERARDLKKKPAYIIGAGETARHAARGQRDFLEIAAHQSGRLAFERAGVAHKDIDMAMIYDSFTITVLTTLENLGFCKRGEGGAFVAGGRLRYDGELPINTDGGGLSSNHPGMRGIFLVIEAVKQLRGECGPRQVKDCKIALVHGTGGALGTRHSGATLILTNQ
ncbi:MAG TPA: acetyl-CoA acetyltransferase [Candidatus Binataceae bacterium]|nr:acetyl-CoA acetyltransferase [Candidatus Binataceae bacterium]